MPRPPNLLPVTPGEDLLQHAASMAAVIVERLCSRSEPSQPWRADSLGQRLGQGDGNENSDTEPNAQVATRMQREPDAVEAGTPRTVRRTEDASQASGRAFKLMVELPLWWPAAGGSLLGQRLIVDLARELQARGDVELVKRVAQVCLNGLDADELRCGDLGVSHPVGHEPRDLELAAGE